MEANPGDIQSEDRKRDTIARNHNKDTLEPTNGNTTVGDTSIPTKPLEGEKDVVGRGAHAQYRNCPETPARVRGRDRSLTNGNESTNSDAHVGDTQSTERTMSHTEEEAHADPEEEEDENDGNEHKRQYHWKRDDKKHWRNPNQSKRQRQAWLRQARHVSIPPSATLEEAGKTVRGDADASDEEATADEADGEDGHEPDTTALDIQVIISEEDACVSYPQYVNVATSEVSLQAVDEDGNDVYVPDPNAVLIDGYIYAGERAHAEMDGSEFIVTDKLQHSYIITTAVLRRSGNHPERIIDIDTTVPTKAAIQATKELEALPDLETWLRGKEMPHSTVCQGMKMCIDSTIVLHAFRQPVTLQGCKFVVVPSNEVRIIMGCKMAAEHSRHPTGSGPKPTTSK